MAKHKYIETPEKFKELWNNYELSVKSKPKLKHVFVGKDGKENFEQKERPLSWDGFELYVAELGIIDYPDLSEYCDEGGKGNPSYSAYFPLSRACKKKVRVDHIDGGMTGIYNPNITASLNGLKTETKNVNENTNLNTTVEIIKSDAPLSSNEKDISLD